MRCRKIGMKLSLSKRAARRVTLSEIQIIYAQICKPNFPLVEVEKLLDEVAKIDCERSVPGSAPTLAAANFVGAVDLNVAIPGEI